MTKDEIIEMARQAGLHLYVNDIIEKPYAEIVVAFAHLVAAKALAQQEQEPPVAFEYDEDNDPIGEVVGFIKGSNYIMVKVYDGKQVSLNDDLYDTPPQRTWVGLTDEEIQECYNGAYKIVQGRRLEYAFYKTIEAKLRKKNT